MVSNEISNQVDLCIENSIYLNNANNPYIYSLYFAVCKVILYISLFLITTLSGGQGW